MNNKLTTLITKTNTNSKNFRLQGKTLFLTYSQVNKDLTKEEILNQLQAKLCIKNYLIAKEYHKDMGVHIHVLIELFKRCNIRNQTKLDLYWEMKEYHGNYQIAKNIDAIRLYLLKGDDILTNWEIDYKTGKIISMEDKLALMTIRFGANRTLDYYISNHPEKLSKFSRIESNLKRLDRHLQRRNKEQALYDINSFEFHKEIDQSLLDKTCTTWISGPSGTRKTSYVEARIEANRNNGIIQDYIFIRHLDQLKQFDANKHELIIIDDCKLPSNREDMINILDVERKGAINVKYDVVTIPANVKRVIISNQRVHEMLHSKKLTNDLALIRRIKEVYVNTAIKIKDKELTLI